MMICMSLVCALLMQASEKKSQKKDLNLDELRSAVRQEREEHQKTRGADYIRGLEVKRNKILSEKSATEDKK